MSRSPDRRGGVAGGGQAAQSLKIDDEDERGHALASLSHDSAMRGSFLDNVAANREIMDEAARTRGEKVHAAP